MIERKASVTKASSATPIIYVVDDDESMREALLELFLSLKMDAAGFESASAFLNSIEADRPGCILLDVRLPGINGLDFQHQLESMGNRTPIVFMTGFGDIPMSVRAMKAGAVDFLTKPFRDQDVLDAVAVALEKDSAIRREWARSNAVLSLIETLTPREREVMDAVVLGRMNKQIAFDLGISEITVKLHRGNVMHKMQARSVADLVRMSEVLVPK